jgi:inner membrane protein YidH
MINRYSDHAANERTFLAWIRTAIAVMAFGFLVEKFDLFLEIASRSMAGKPPPATGRLAGDIAGLLLIVLGAVMMVIATLRFRQVGNDIDAADQRPAHGKGMDVTLVLLLLALGTTLFVYLLFTVLRQIG